MSEKKIKPASLVITGAVGAILFMGGIYTGAVTGITGIQNKVPKGCVPCEGKWFSYEVDHGTHKQTISKKIERYRKKKGVCYVLDEGMKLYPLDSVNCD